MPGVALSQDLPPEPTAAVEETIPAPIVKKEAKPLPTLESSSSEKKVVAGPLEAQRQQLYNQIQAAQDNGIGIKNYMMAFDYIEKMAANGESEEAIKKRMVPLVGALASQLKTKEYLKTKPKMQQAPGMAGNLDPSQILAPGQSIDNNLRMFGGMGGSQTGDLINKIVKQKGLQNKIPAGMDQNFLKEKLKDPKIQEMIKKYRNQHGL